jgi:hypothetical protein
MDGNGWGHSSMQCNSSCKASGVRHQGHALRDLGTRGLTWRKRLMSRWCEFCAQFYQADELAVWDQLVARIHGGRPPVLVALVIDWLSKGHAWYVHRVTLCL